MNGRKKVEKPQCSKHCDCFANRDGKCVSLQDNDFGNRECPFYKLNTEVDLKEVAKECKAYAITHGGQG